MTILFEIRTNKGSLHTGHVQGAGGFLGGGATHLGHDREREVAARELQRIIDFVNRTGEMPKGIARRPNGCCVLHPPSSKEFKSFEAYSSAIETVPLSGAAFRVLN